MTESAKGQLRDGILVPAELVERSAFLDKGSGINESETLTLNEKISAWFHGGELQSVVTIYTKYQ